MYFITLLNRDMQQKKKQRKCQQNFTDKQKTDLGTELEHITGTRKVKLQKEAFEHCRNTQ